MAALDVVVQFLSDTSKLQSDLREVEGTTNKVGAGFQAMGRKIAGALGAAAIVKFGADATFAAADMAESQNKLEAVFGDTTRKIRKHLDGLVSDTLGSTKLATDAAGTFGNMFTQMGLAGDGALTLSKDMLTLTADLVSFHNAEPSEVVEAIGAAFRGEYDSVQKWIPAISAAAVEQKALAQTGKASTDELTAGDKALATHTLLMEGAGKATGDAAKTADSATNQNRKLHRQFEDMTVQVGQALLPVMQAVVPIISDLAKAFQDAGPAITGAAIGLGVFAAVALALGGTVAVAVAAVVGLVAAVVWLWDNWDQVWNWMKDHPAIVALVAVLAAPIAALVTMVGAVKFLWENWDQIWGWIKQAASDAADWIGGAVDDIEAFVTGIPGAIASALSTVWDVLTAPFRLARDTISGLVSEIKGFFTDAVNVGRSIFNEFVRRWNRFEFPSFDLPFGMGEIGGGGLPHIEPLAKGGIVTGPTLALIGERGPEAVVPLPASGMGQVVNIHVEVAAGTNPAAVGASIVDAIRQYERVAGRSWRGAA